MKKYLLFIATCVFLTASCVTSKGGKYDTTYINNEKDYDKIQIHIESEYGLNLIKGEPTPIDVCIYELNSKGHFGKIAFDEKEKKNKKLLSCQVFDASVNKATLITIAPEKDYYFEINRYKNLNQIAIVADYQNYNPKTSIRLHSVPKTINNAWEWAKKDNQSPYIATITHKFGSFGINKIKKR